MTQGRNPAAGLWSSGSASAASDGTGAQAAGWQPVLIEKAPQRRSGVTSSVCSARARRRRTVGILDRLHDRTAYDGANYDMDRFGEWRRASASGTSRRAVDDAARDVEQAASRRCRGLEIRYSTVPTAIEQDDDGVTVTLADTADGTTSRAVRPGRRADGLRSTVRRLAFGRTHATCAG